MDHCRRGTRYALLALTSLLCVAIPSLATAAPAVPGATPQVADFPAGEFCSFPLEVTFRDGTKLHKDSSRVFSTGPLSVTATNLASGASRTFNASGPTFRNGTLTGNALIGQPASRGVGPAFLIINRGRVTFNSDDTIRTITGSQIDVCAALS
jgi:hypothetical protein